MADGGGSRSAKEREIVAGKGGRAERWGLLSGENRPADIKAPGISLPLAAPQQSRRANQASDHRERQTAAKGIRELAAASAQGKRESGEGGEGSCLLCATCLCLRRWNKGATVGRENPLGLVAWDMKARRRHRTFSFAFASRSAKCSSRRTTHDPTNKQAERTHTRTTNTRAYLTRVDTLSRGESE